ncbi:MAG: GNAT family N-acetyltransferase [Methanosarcina sp.]|jgi:ribosomal protein S18 acetylase RimI-like enzyme
MSEIWIGFAEMNDLNSWMELVKLVSWNFPGLETKELIQGYKGNTLVKNIKRKSAICAKDGERVVGVLLFSIKYNMLGCMAVHPDYRRSGIASELIQLMLNNLDKERDAVVTTFREGDEKGIAPRTLYKKLGFVEDELCEEFGYPQQKFIFHRY